MEKGWLKANLGIEGDLAEAWKTHVDNLTRIHVRIGKEEIILFGQETKPWVCA
jgi:hypothetical protein